MAARVGAQGKQAGKSIASITIFCIELFDLTALLTTAHSTFPSGEMLLPQHVD